jgi:hypothetical protein
MRANELNNLVVGDGNVTGVIVISVNRTKVNVALHIKKRYLEVDAILIIDEVSIIHQ